MPMTISATEQNNKLQQINEQLRTRNNLSGIVNEDLFWVLSNERRIVVDNNSNIQIWSLNTNAHYAAQVATLTTQIDAINIQINNNTPPLWLQQLLATERSRNPSVEAAAMQATWTILPAQVAAMTTSITNEKQRNIADINTQITALENQRTPLEAQRIEYNNIITTYWPILFLRRTELTAVTTAISNFNITNTVPNTAPTAYNWNLAFAGWAVNLNLDTRFRWIWALPISYNFCDNTTWATLAWNTANGWQVPVNGTNVTIRWLQIAWNTLSWTGVTIEPVEGIQFPLNVEIAIRGRIFESTTTTNLDTYKTLRLTLQAPQLAWANTANPTGAGSPRAAAYTNLNIGWAINTRLAAEYSDPNRTTLENDVIWTILRENGNQAEIERIYNNEQQRNILIQRIRGIPGLIPIFPLPHLQTGFLYEMIREDRNIPVQYLINQQAFADYLRLNMNENVTTFVRTQIRNGINTTAQRNNILRMVMDFQSDIINNRLDNNDHNTLDLSISNLRPQAHPNNRWQRLTRRNSNKNNWTKFLDGRESKKFEDKLETNEGELGFDIQVAVHGVNKIVTTINIKGEDEPIILDTRDVNEMTHMILRLEATKSGEPINRKLRCRMAMNAVKAIVSISPVTLHRQYDGNVTAIDGQIYTIDRISAHIRWDNLVLRGSCAASHINRQRVNHVIFNEQRYKWLHNINELERGMVGLSHQVNNIMNAMGNEFREATSRIKAAPLMTYNTKYYLRWWPIKRLRGRMVYGKTNYNFDFDTTATSGSKKANIKFEKGIFTVSGTFKNKPYEFKGKNLGMIIRKKIDRVRIFDGLELPMFEKINESFIEKLRTNNLIGPENFWVSDFNTNKTGRVFFMDNHWHLSYTEIEDRNLNPLRNGRTYGRINPNDLPPQRIRCNETERREFMQNPLLSGRLIRAMRGRLQLI